MQVQSLYMSAVVLTVAIAAVSKLALLMRPRFDDHLLSGRRDEVLYAASKLAPVLAVAFAVAADASGNTTLLNAVIGIVALTCVAGLTAWSIHGRLTGQFFGWAHKLRGR